MLFKSDTCLLVVHLLPVLTVCQPIENGVLAWTMYMVTGLWLSGPDPQDRSTVVSVMSVTTRSSGAPGGPVTPRNKDTWISFTVHKKWQIQIPSRVTYTPVEKKKTCFRSGGAAIDSAGSVANQYAELYGSLRV